MFMDACLNVNFAYHTIDQTFCPGIDIYVIFISQVATLINMFFNANQCSNSLSYDPGSLLVKDGNNNNYPLNERIQKQIVLGEEYLHFKRKLVEVQVEKYSVFSICPYSYFQCHHVSNYYIQVFAKPKRLIWLNGNRH